MKKSITMTPRQKKALQLHLKIERLKRELGGKKSVNDLDKSVYINYYIGKKERVGKNTRDSLQKKLIRL